MIKGLPESTFILGSECDSCVWLSGGATDVLVLAAQTNHFPGNTSEEAAPLRATLLRSQSPSAVQIKEPNHYQHHKLGNPLTTTRLKGGSGNTCTDLLTKCMIVFSTCLCTMPGCFHLLISGRLFWLRQISCNIYLFFFQIQNSLKLRLDLFSSPTRQWIIRYIIILYSCLCCS